MNFSITDAEINDSKDIVDYLNIVLGETDFLLNGKNECPFSVEEEKETIKNIKRTNKDIILLAKNEKDEIIGVSTCFRLKGRKSHIATLGITVKKEYWGNGVGSSLLKDILTKAKDIGIEKVILEVVCDNEKAINLYKKFGFEIEGMMVKSIKVNDKYYDELFMARIF